jgi:hypothetical protein
MTFAIARDSGNETRHGLETDRETLGRDASAAPPPWHEGNRLGNFLLKQLLGHGTSGYVFRAMDLSDRNRTCALKLLLPDSVDQLLWNKLGFRRMMPVEHHNLMRVYRIHQLDKYVGLSMEEVRGETFSRARRKLHLLDPSQAYDRLLSLLQQYASGLAMMHQHGFVHRDMKPGNLMVSFDGVAKIIDYGLVDLFEFNATDCKPRGMLVGTPRYMAPEVYWSQRYLPSGDIYGLGIVCLETLLSIQTHANETPQDLVREFEDHQRDRDQIDEAIVGLGDAVPEVIRDLCTQMLSCDPADRPTAIELARTANSSAVSVRVPAPEALLGRDREMAQIDAWTATIFSGAASRLHLSGPAGIGKSRLLKEVIQRIEAKRWGQLFVSRCRSREDQPLQAFDQICDAIADRYRQSDREPLELDPVSFAILTGGFPVLAKVLRSSPEILPPPATNVGMDALEAAVRLSHQLRLVGPLFLIVDDSQWADVDSRNLLDRLAVATGREGIGIITISDQADDHRAPAQQTLQLDPLSMAESVALLTQFARRLQVNLDREMLTKIAQLAGGNPYRLNALINEFRLGGSLESEPAELEQTTGDAPAIERLWNRRIDRLSPDAKRLLPLVVTAGGKMATAQLAELTGLHESVDAAISELAQQHLIVDQATGGQCIEIAHDRVAESILNTLSEQQIQEAHQAWAMQLARKEPGTESAARIAGHFYAANLPGQATTYAIFAGQDAEQRLATYEAGKWYQRAAGFLDGTEQITQLKNAARCFQDADYSTEAAACLQELVELDDHNLSPEEQFEFQKLAMILLIRNGSYGQSRAKIDELAKRLRIPRPKPLWFATLAVWARQLQRQTRGRQTLVQAIVDQIAEPRNPSPDDAPIGQRLALCSSLVRTLSFFDNRYAAELSLYGEKHLASYPDLTLRINAAVGEAVFGCYDRGRRRQRSEADLMRLAALVPATGNAASIGDVAAGLAMSHALAGRWSDVVAHTAQAIQIYRETSNRFGFEIAHTALFETWAMWHLGRWDQLRTICQQMHAEAIRRNNGFDQIIAANSYAAAAWLASDDVKSLRQIQAANARIVDRADRVQFVHVCNWASVTMRLLYEGRYDEAWNDYQVIRPYLRKRPFSSVQLIRVLRRQLAAVISLHQLHQRFSEAGVMRVSLSIQGLRRERTPLASMLANFYNGLLMQRITLLRQDGHVQAKAIQFLSAAREQAIEQQLAPFQLAATDAIAALETNQPTDHLTRWMRQENILDPTQFKRTLTVEM